MEENGDDVDDADNVDVDVDVDGWDTGDIGVMRSVEVADAVELEEEEEEGESGDEARVVDGDVLIDFDLDVETDDEEDEDEDEDVSVFAVGMNVGSGVVHAGVVHVLSPSQITGNVSYVVASSSRFIPCNNVLLLLLDAS